MTLTVFGKEIRKARIDIGYTLRTMAAELETSPAFLSGMETGSKKISKTWVKKIDNFFRKQNHEIPRLDELADISNQSVSLDGLSQQHQMLVAGFANSPFTPDELKKFAQLLEDLSKTNTEEL